MALPNERKKLKEQQKQHKKKKKKPRKDRGQFPYFVFTDLSTQRKELNDELKRIMGRFTSLFYMIENSFAFRRCLLVARCFVGRFSGWIRQWFSVDAEAVNADSSACYLLCFHSLMYGLFFFFSDILLIYRCLRSRLSLSSTCVCKLRFKWKYTFRVRNDFVCGMFTFAQMSTWGHNLCVLMISIQYRERLMRKHINSVENRWVMQMRKLSSHKMSTENRWQSESYVSVTNHGRWNGHDCKCHEEKERSEKTATNDKVLNRGGNLMPSCTASLIITSFLWPHTCLACFTNTLF